MGGQSGDEPLSKLVTTNLPVKPGNNSTAFEGASAAGVANHMYSHGQHLVTWRLVWHQVLSGKMDVEMDQQPEERQVFGVYDSSPPTI